MYGKSKGGSISKSQTFSGGTKAPLSRRIGSMPSLAALPTRSLRVVVLGSGGVGKTGALMYCLVNNLTFY